MITDTELRVKGFKALAEALGTVEAEKFLGLVMREPFDYTEWQKNLWPDRTVEEISASAMSHRKLARNRGAKPASRTTGAGGRGR